MRDGNRATAATGRYVPGGVIVGPHGLPMVTRGYREIPCTDGHVRIYDDMAVVGDHGQPVLSKGKIEVVPNRRPTEWG